MSERRTTCAVLADRSLAMTEGVRGLLETVFETVVTVANVASLIESVVRLEPDIVVADVSLAGDGGLRWLQDLRRRCPAVKLIALSVHDEPGVREALTRAGCAGFVLKRDVATKLLPTIERVLD